MDFHNHQYDAVVPNGIPLAVGDRYYAQDLGRDFWANMDASVRALWDALTGGFAGSSGGLVLEAPSQISKGTGDTLTIYNGIKGLVILDVQVPDSFASLPPTTKAEEVAVRIDTPSFTNEAIPSATLNGVAKNYIKISPVLVNSKLRPRAKKASSYYYEVELTAILTVNTTNPTPNDLTIGTLVGTAGGGDWVIDITPPLNTPFGYPGANAISMNRPVGIGFDGRLYPQKYTELTTGISDTGTDSSKMKLARIGPTQWVQCRGYINTAIQARVVYYDADGDTITAGSTWTAVDTLSGAQIQGCFPIYQDNYFVIWYIDNTNDEINFRVGHWNGTNAIIWDTTVQIAGNGTASITGEMVGSQFDPEVFGAVYNIDAGTESVRIYRYDGSLTTGSASGLSLSNPAHIEMAFTADGEIVNVYDVSGSNLYARTRRYNTSTLALSSAGTGNEFFTLSDSSNFKIFVTETKKLVLAVDAGIFTYAITDAGRTLVQLGGTIYEGGMGHLGFAVNLRPLDGDRIGMCEIYEEVTSDAEEQVMIFDISDWQPKLIFETTITNVMTSSSYSGFIIALSPGVYVKSIRTSSSGTDVIAFTFPIYMGISRFSTTAIGADQEKLLPLRSGEIHRITGIGTGVAPGTFIYASITGALTANPDPLTYIKIGQIMQGDYFKVF